MPSIRSPRSLLAVIAAGLLTPVFAVSNAFATPDSTRRPVILDSQGGINDGQSGTVMRTGPTSWQPIVGAQPMATPTELASPESSVPIVVAPYIQLPAGGGSPPRPLPRPVPRPQ
nr:hypothetical protein [Paraburkholderia ginsengisoli]